MIPLHPWRCISIRFIHEATGPTWRKPKPATTGMNCVSCASAAIPAHTGLCDRLYGSAGEWSLHRCENHACDLHWLDPQPTPAQLRAAYAVYYTHESADKTPRGGLLSRLARGAVSGYLERRYGYSVPRELEPWKCLWPALYLLPARRVGAEREVMFLSAQPGARLLDVGCGSGDRLSKMNQLGWCSEGVEPDPAAAATARWSSSTNGRGRCSAARAPWC